MAELTPGAGPRPCPTDEQHRAADPEASVWVSASAGTGKTRVLSNRLLRLLLHGADPADILCLTYTKAGAAEMARRVRDDLARFAVLARDVLIQELTGLLGRAPRGEEIGRARTGLARVLDLPAGLRIMTIHSFCQSLLRRFPLEAGVSPHFELLEPRAAAALLQRARDRVLTSREPALHQAIARLAVALGEYSLGEALAELNDKRIRLQRLLADHGDVDGVIARIGDLLEVAPGTTVESLHRAACRDPAIDRQALTDAARALLTGSKSDVSAGQTIAAWLEADAEQRLQGLGDYRQVFLTKEGEARKKLLTKGVGERFPHVLATLEAEQARLLALAGREKAVVVAERTAALLQVGAAIIEVYEQQKAAQGLLDYQDLIERSRALLIQPDVGLWVRYKLDQQIDHLLIDESQDTSPDQWAIVEALIDDFFSGDGGRERPPTLFVVGDEKQSIFGFQGADVATFQRLRATFADRARQAGLPWRETPLTRSFRSAPAILAAVDAVFAEPGMLSGDRPMDHRAFDETAFGMVEVWPLIEPMDRPAAPEPWRLPDLEQRVEQSERRLAQAITREIFGWLRDRVPLANRDRPIEPGDVMILLPRRGILQDLLVRELKKQQVPVAGADRLVLGDELAVMDLMALGDALLLPDDDLTMATVLRSPLFGLSDDDLFRLAYDRGDRPLFRRLHDLRDERAVFARADDMFRALLARVDFTPPFEFYARFLAEGRPNGRQRLLQRFGAAAALPIEAFLAQAIAFEKSHPPSLQGFLHWLRLDSDAVKRDANEPRDEVRVLTVHGAKGLEAPIVFLADTTYDGASLRHDKLLWRDDGLPLWKMGEKRRDPVSEAARERQLERLRAEHRRLLYVAMTRAGERLIVTGWRRRNAGSRQSWHDLIVAGMERLAGAERVGFDLGAGDRGEGWRFSDRPSTAPASGQGAGAVVSPARPDIQAVPSWLAEPAGDETRARILHPSADPAADDPVAASPLGDGGRRRFGRGRLIHRLLQILPDHPPARRPEILRRFLEKPGLRLAAEAKEDLARRILTILETPEWAPLFGAESRAEVPLIGEIGGRMVNGQVDRLAVLANEVVVLDYKTDRPPPRHPGEVPAAYCRQMAIYRALLATIHPGRTVRCALLWTEAPDLMILDDSLLRPFDPPPAAS